MNKNFITLLLLFVFVVLEVGGCIMLLKFTRWEIAVAVLAMLWGHHLLTWIIAKRKRDSIPPTIWEHIYQ